jgi:superfamily II DNA or RNA helicase
MTFTYSLVEGIQDGHVRPVSFWCLDASARTFDRVSGRLLDERPVREYLEEVPAEVKAALFDPDGAFVERAIRKADEELTLRRRKYVDAGCLIVCPPGFHDDEGAEDRIAELIHRKVEALTGKKALLILNGTPTERIREARESDVPFVIAVNRIAEGCDLPRLRVLLLLRDLSGSELLFLQILGRILRRRREDDEEPALAIIPPLHLMLEMARRILVAGKEVVPKKVEICQVCRRIPCQCPCKRCGLPRKQCRCPCPVCGQYPCVCDWPPPWIEAFAELEAAGDSHIVQGTDVENRFAVRAGTIRHRIAACSHRDLGNMAFILQCDEEVNGRTAGPAPDPGAVAPQVIASAQNWLNLRDAVPVKMRRLVRFFREQPKPFEAAWRHLNKMFFPGSRWSDVKDDPARLSFDLLKRLHAYLDRAGAAGGQL